MYTGKASRLYGAGCDTSMHPCVGTIFHKTHISTAAHLCASSSAACTVSQKVCVNDTRFTGNHNVSQPVVDKCFVQGSYFEIIWNYN